MDHKIALIKLLFRLSLPIPFVLLAGCSSVAPGMHMHSSTMSPALNADNQVVPQKVEVIDGALLQRQAIAAQQEKVAELANYHKPAGFSVNTSNYHYLIRSQDALQIVIWNQAEANAAAVASATSAMVSSTLGAGGMMPGGGGVGSGSNIPATNAQNLSNVFIVNSQGQIFYPYLGHLTVAGKTASEIQRMVTERVAKYIQNPQVTVQVVGFNSQKVAITGSVHTPTNLPITNIPLTVLSAVTLAGGPASCGNGAVRSTESELCADLRHVKIQRGRQTAIVDLNKLRAINDTSNNWILKSGDIVLVPNMNDSRIFVLGAVNAPGPYNMVDGTISLRDALGNASGVNTISNPAYTYVIRNYRRDPRVYLLNLSSPDALNLAGDFNLKPGDVVFVSTSAFQDFSSVLNQITPAVALAAFAKSMST